MFGPQWRRCSECGQPTYDLELHTCDQNAVASQEVAKLAAEFELLDGTHPNIDTGCLKWKPFATWYAQWLQTNAGRFQMFYWHRMS